MRLFLGLPVPPEIASTLSSLPAPLPQNARRTRPSDMHVTLSFLGTVLPTQLDCLCAELEPIAHAPLAISLSGLGSFPGGVFFADVLRTPELLALAADVAAHVARCGFPPERRPFHPHVTLARTRSRLPQHRELPFIPLTYTADEFILYSSHSVPGGSTYEHLRRFPLNLAS